MKVEVEDVDLAKMAADVRAIADEIEKGTYVAFAMVGCGQDGTASHACMVDAKFATHDLLDEMIHDVKEMLFESHEAGT